MKIIMSNMVDFMVGSKVIAELTIQDKITWRFKCPDFNINDSGEMKHKETNVIHDMEIYIDVETRDYTINKEPLMIEELFEYLFDGIAMYHYNKVVYEIATTVCYKYSFNKSDYNEISFDEALKLASIEYFTNKGHARAAVVRDYNTINAIVKKIDEMS